MRFDSERIGSDIPSRRCDAKTNDYWYILGLFENMPEHNYTYILEVRRSLDKNKQKYMSLL